MKKNYLILLSLCILSACQADTQHNQDDVLSEIRANWDQFIEYWEAGNAAGCVSFYSESGINVPNTMEANRGRSEIESFYESLFNLKQSSEYTHTITDLYVDGDSAIELGEFRVAWVSNDGDEWTYHARSLTHWKRTSSGEWKIEKFLFNAPPEG